MKKMRIFLAVFAGLMAVPGYLFADEPVSDPVTSKLRDLFVQGHSPERDLGELRMGTTWTCTVNWALRSMFFHFQETPGFRFKQMKARWDEKIKIQNEFKYPGEREVDDRIYTMGKEGISRENRYLWYVDPSQQAMHPEKGVHFRSYETVRVTEQGFLISERSMSQKDLQKISQADPVNDYTGDSSDVDHKKVVYQYIYCVTP